ncbi:MAG: tRNA (adenosine(37)-N6)-methyltransferase TrmM, partial [Prevotellaceae bacterium]|nr:tRNA (adenosine(37)-N6)-methyltransferase TrmM [Prevotellaceae bacterium]
MSSKNFSFKQFVINHDKSAMKVGVDGVMLGAWTDVTNA